MQKVTIRNREYPVVWASSGALGVSFKPGIFWYEHLPVFKQAAERLRAEDVLPTTKSLGLRPILGNELLHDNGETPQRFFPRSICVDFMTATTLNSFGHSGWGIACHLEQKLWSDISRPWVLSVVSDRLNWSERECEYQEICERLLAHKFAVPPIIELAFGCPNIKLDMSDMFSDSTEIISLCRRALGEDWTIGANISPVAPLNTFYDAEDAGADYLRICNSIPHWFVPDRGCAGLPEKMPWRKASPLVARQLKPGGYSGPMCVPIILERVEEVRRGIAIPIGFGNGFYDEESICQGFEAGGDFLSLGMVKLVRPWRVSGLIDFAKSYAN